MEAVQKQPRETVVKHVERGVPHTVMTLPSQRTLAFGRNPHPQADNEPGLYARAAIEALQDLERVAQVSGGQAGADSRKHAMGQVHAVTDKLTTYAASLEREEAELYRPPVPTQVEAIEDMEIRAYARNLKDEARTKLLESIKDDPRVMIAFARDPLRSPILHQLGTAKWRERVAQEKPEAVQSLQLRKDSIGWARSVLARVQGLIDTTPVQQ